MNSPCSTRKETSRKGLRWSFPKFPPENRWVVISTYRWIFEVNDSGFYLEIFFQIKEENAQLIRHCNEQLNLPTDSLLQVLREIGEMMQENTFILSMLAVNEAVGSLAQDYWQKENKETFMFLLLLFIILFVVSVDILNSWHCIVCYFILYIFILVLSIDSKLKNF